MNINVWTEVESFEVNHPIFVNEAHFAETYGPCIRIFGQCDGRKSEIHVYVDSQDVEPRYVEGGSDKSSDAFWFAVFKIDDASFKQIYRSLLDGVTNGKAVAKYTFDDTQRDIATNLILKCTFGK